MRRKRQSGLTLVELIVAFTIMMILTSMAVPLARYKVQRDKERDLEYALREIRNAIDKCQDRFRHLSGDATAVGGRNQSDWIGGQEDEVSAPHS
jgi:type II secretory pathway pseudopilin PulG